MLNKKLQIILFFIITLGFTQLTNAGNILVQLRQPPPNQFHVEDMWKVEITNSTKEDLNIFLKGTVTEEKEGLIVEGKSYVFTVKPGKTTYGYDDFKKGNINWMKNNYEEPIKKGMCPPGEYKMCVTAFYEKGEEADLEQCITQTIVGTTTGNRGVLANEIGPIDVNKKSIVFSWTVTNLTGPYKLTIVELKKGQSNEEAMKNNKELFKKDNIKNTTYVYTLDNSKFKPGKKYAWQIVCEDVESNIVVFSVTKE
jgi:hypothetical protein